MCMHFFGSAAACITSYGVAFELNLLMRMSLGLMVSVSDLVISCLLLRMLIVRSTVSLGIGMRITFSKERRVVFASGYVCHSWNSVEREFL